MVWLIWELAPNLQEQDASDARLVFGTFVSELIPSTFLFLIRSLCISATPALNWTPTIGPDHGP